MTYVYLCRQAMHQQLLQCTNSVSSADQPSNGAWRHKNDIRVRQFGGNGIVLSLSPGKIEIFN